MGRTFLFFILFFTVTAHAQKGYYTSPVKIPMFLSASFAELRTNHFHSGIDIKTQGVTGIPVLSVADGFVSRISVSPSGFGNALYIDHYNGTTSVYGHLSSFRNDIQDYIKKIQYKKKSFKVDIPVSPETFLIEKGEMVAVSGNSGSSGGPHLHFEIRDTKSEEPINPLLFGFNVADNTPPKIFTLLVSPLSENAQVNFQAANKKYPVVFMNGKYKITNNPVIPVFGKIGFAIEANDFFDNTSNKCGINKMQLKVDGETNFSVDLNRLSFSDSRFINSYVAYNELMTTGRRFQKTWIDPGNLLHNYEINRNQGIIEFENNGQVHEIEIELMDTYGNTSVLEFNVECKQTELPPVQPNFTQFFNYDKDNKWSENEIDLEIPKGALYNSFGFLYSNETAGKGVYSGLHHIHKNTVPIHTLAKLKIKPQQLNKHLESKALLVMLDEKTGQFHSVGGEFKEDYVQADIRTFGTFAVRVDTVPPVIKPLSIVNKNTLTESNRIRFIISDDLAGIDKIEGTIDGNWALFEYDAKNNLIAHYFDPGRFEMGKTHDFKLMVTDYKNNISTYEATFWK